MFSLRQAAMGVAMLATASNAISRLDIDPTTMSFVDQNQNQIILHGVNVVYKVAPYIPSTADFDSQDSLNDEDIANLKKWGMNFVRLGVMWEGVEREKGVYDENYLNEIETLINRLGENGIYTLVDAHQDVFSRQICGEGVPTFYADDAIGRKPTCFNRVLDPILSPILQMFGVCTDFDSFGFQKDSDGLPLITDCQTRDFYTYYETKQAFDAFHSLLVENKNGIQDNFVAFWDRVTERFAGNDYVVGYDPLNEPLAGNPTKELKNLIPGHFDKNYLAPMYAKIYQNAMKHDSTKHLWFEPVPMPDELGVLNGFVFPVGFDVPPGGEIGSANHALNDHTYCCQLSFSECTTGEPKVEDADKCLAWHHKRLDTRADDAKRLGIPFIITEFGACLTEGPCTQEINQVAQVADEILAGWAYWQFKTYEDLTTSAGTGSEGFYNQDGTLQEYKVKALGRPYMPTTQGTLTTMKYDDDANTFHAEFTLGSSTSPSVVFVNDAYYFTCGINHSVKVGDTYIPDGLVDFTDGFLTFQLDQTAFAVGSTVTVDVTAAACQ